MVAKGCENLLSLAWVQGKDFRTILVRLEENKK